MKDYFQAERLKYRHSFIKKLLILMPILCTLLAAGMTYEYFVIDAYNWWYITLYPALLAIVCGTIGAKDGKLKNKVIFQLPCDIRKVWDAKVLIGIAASGISVLTIGVLSVMLSTAMKVGLQVNFKIEISILMQLVGCLVIWISSLWQIPCCLLLSQKIGMLPMLVLHIGFNFISATIIALKPWYAMVPGAILSRMMCVILRVLPNGLPAVSTSVTYTPELVETQNLFIGILAAVFWFLLFWGISRKCFERQVA